MKSLMPLVDYSPLSLELNSTKLLRYGSFFIRKGGDLDADNDINAGVIIDGYAVVRGCNRSQSH